MWRRALILVGCLVALPVPFQVREPGAADRPAAEAIACDGVGAHTGRLYHNLLGHELDAGGLAYWVGERLGSSTGDNVAYWTTQSDELAVVWSYRDAPMCATVRRLGLTEVQPGLAVGQTGQTITVVGDRRAVTFRADDGPPRHASSVEGDIVVNANWFTAQGAQAPIVTNGRLGGSADIPERGQLLARRPGCTATGAATELQHLWTGDTYEHDPCIVAAVSGVSLVHNGLRADAYPGFNITTGYTNTSRSHSFIGFNDTEIVIVATREMTASQLADYALSLGLTEGVMLDGGGSTQIATPTTSLTSNRAVPAFAVLDSAYG